MVACLQTVFVIGCNEGIIPVSWSKDVVNGGGVEEEKRLFYVALTRASQRLFISYTMNPDDERDVPSSFLSVRSALVNTREARQARSSLDSSQPLHVLPGRMSGFDDSRRCEAPSKCLVVFVSTAIR